MLRKHFKKIIAGVCLVLIGTVIVFPVEAHVVGSKNAHTLDGKHLNYFSPRSWVKKYFATKSYVKEYAYPRSGVYTKNQADSRYYQSSEVDTLLANYLTSITAASTYLTQSSASSTYLTPATAASTYLTQSNASSTYLTQANATSNYLPLSGGTLAGALEGTSLTGTSFAYTSAASRVLSIPQGATMPLADLQLSQSNLGVYKSAGTGSEALMPVNLPDGAIVTAVEAYYYDNNGNTNVINATLYKHAHDGSTQDLMAAVNSPTEASPGHTSKRDTGIDYATIDNDGYYYSFDLNFVYSSTNLTLKSIKIEYTVTQPD